MANSLIDKSLQTLREKGLLSFVEKSSRFLYFKSHEAWSELKQSIYSLGFIDKFCFERSVDRLEKTKSEANSAKDVLPALDRYSGFGHYKDIEIDQVQYEFEKLLDLVKEDEPNIIMEIGTRDGGTFFGWVNISSPDTAISLDLPGGSFGGGYPEERGKFYRRFNENTNFKLFRGNSHSQEMKNKVDDFLGEKEIDFLFIDGDHTYEGVKNDFEMYSGFVSEGGIIAFHDVCKHPDNESCNVDKFWKEVKENYETEEIINDREQGWGGIGVVYL